MKNPLILMLLVTAPLLAELPRDPQVYTYSGVDSVAGVLHTPSGQTLVSDPGNGRVSEFNAAGLSMASVLPNTPSDGLLTGVDMDASGNVVLAQTDPSRVTVYGPDGSVRFSIATENAEDPADDPASETVLFNPSDVAFGADGRIYVADMGHNRIAVYSGVDGHFLSAWGHLGFYGQQELYEPHGLTVANGLVYVADSGNARVMVYDTEGKFVRQIGSRGFTPDHFDSPFDVAVDGQGNIWVADNGQAKVCVFSQAGELLKLYGQGSVSFEDPMSLYAGEDGTVLMGDGYTGRVMAFETGVAFSRAGSVKSGAEISATTRLDDAKLAFGPVPARAGQPMMMQLPFTADRITWEVLSLDMRRVAGGDEHHAMLASMPSTQDLASGVYLVRTRVQVGEGSRQEIQKIIVTR